MAKSIKLHPSRVFEDPCSKLQGIFDRKECGLLMMRSLTPPQTAGNALALAVQGSGEQPLFFLTGKTGTPEATVRLPPSAGGKEPT
jgi:hypothetical protein